MKLRVATLYKLGGGVTQNLQLLRVYLLLSRCDFFVLLYKTAGFDYFDAVLSLEGKGLLVRQGVTFLIGVLFLGLIELLERQIPVSVFTTLLVLVLNQVEDVLVARKFRDGVFLLLNQTVLNFVFLLPQSVELRFQVLLEHQILKLVVFPIKTIDISLGLLFVSFSLMRSFLCLVF